MSLYAYRHLMLHFSHAFDQLCLRRWPGGFDKGSLSKSCIPRHPWFRPRFTDRSTIIQFRCCIRDSQSMSSRRFLRPCNHSMRCSGLPARKRRSRGECERSIEPRLDTKQYNKSASAGKCHVVHSISPSPTIATQFSSQVGHNMIHLEHDYLGKDFTLNAKAINPSPTDLCGVYMGSYLQSITRNLAVGFESLYQRPTPGMADLSTSYLAKYTSSQRDWIATAHLQPAGVLQATYWQKLSEKVEVAADLQLLATPARRDAIATLGAKYDLRMATFRAQVDSTGKVSALLEQRFLPTFAFLVSGELDHFKVWVPTDVSVHVRFVDPNGPEFRQVWCRPHARKFKHDDGGNGGDGDGCAATSWTPVITLRAGARL
jgi:hypothetical protein